MNKGIGCQRFKTSKADKRLWKNWERRQQQSRIDTQRIMSEIDREFETLMKLRERGII